MAEIDPASIARVMIPEFLRELMHSERERLGDGLASVLYRAGMTQEEWLTLERGAAVLSQDRWFAIAAALRMSPAEVALRLHEAVSSRPALWMERLGDDDWQILRRSMTSPRALRSGRTMSADLNGNRPALFYELSTYYPSPDEILSIAAQGDYFKRRAVSRPPSIIDEGNVGDLRSSLHSALDELPEDCLPLLERVMDKFTRFSLKDLAQAYKHFSLSVSKK
ncbi:MAG: hypothetical protein MUC50_00370 [Myxococcota bacterium]|jgi:hypothetical protein|nr:hypothetical protein [Myxococcota bacterium]